MTDAETANDATGQDTRPGGASRRDVQTRDAGQPPVDRARQLIAQRPWLQDVGSLARLTLLATIGAAARLLITPGAVAASAAWIALTAALVFRAHWAFRARPGQEARPPGTWQPGEPPPAGVPAATVEAATRILTQRVASGRWLGAWVEIPRCKDPVRHGRCQDAYSLASGGMIGVCLGEDIARSPSLAAFVLAHEIRHQGAWARHLNIFAARAQLAGWLVAGWVVPWPWLLAAVVVIQAAHTATVWAAEIGCDLGGALAEGRAAALGFLAALNGELRRYPTPGLYAYRFLIIAAGRGYPPWWMRSAIVRACIRTGRRL